MKNFDEVDAKQVIYFMCLRGDILHPTSRTGPDFMFVQFHPARGEVADLA